MSQCGGFTAGNRPVPSALQIVQKKGEFWCGARVVKQLHQGPLARQQPAHWCPAPGANLARVALTGEG